MRQPNLGFFGCFISERELTLLPIRLLSVTFVRPTQVIQIFDSISTALGTLAIHLHPLKISRRSSQGNPSIGGIKPKRGSQVQRFRTYRRLYLGKGAR